MRKYGLGSFVADVTGRVSVFQLAAEVALLALMVLASSWIVRG
jgi:hypothetical protein